MKKWIIGCGVFVLLIILVVVGAVSLLTYKVGSFAKKLSAEFVTLQQTNTAYPFVRPAGDAIDPLRMDAYFAVREDIAASLSKNPLVQKITSKDPKDKPGAMEMITGVTGMAQQGIQDLNSSLKNHKMSITEYRYVSSMIYLTVLDGADRGDKDMSEIAAKWDPEFQKMNMELSKNQQMRGISIDSSSVANDINGVASPFPSGNVELVRPHKDALIKNSFVNFMEIMVSQFITQQAKQAAAQQGLKAPPVVFTPPTPLLGAEDAAGSVAEDHALEPAMAK